MGLRSSISWLILSASSYQLPHRVYAATSYPVLSPNGSAIIIYGYDTGLRIVWRGGRAFRSPKNSVPTAETVESETSESSNDNAVMVIDSDDEAGSEPPKDEQPNADFEEEETEIDSSHPFEHIIRYIDVPLEPKFSAWRSLNFSQKKPVHLLIPFRLSFPR
jgi:hypothetical protein